MKKIILLLAGLVIMGVTAFLFFSKPAFHSRTITELKQQLSCDKPRQSPYQSPYGMRFLWTNAGGFVFQVRVNYENYYLKKFKTGDVLAQGNDYYQQISAFLTENSFQKDLSRQVIYPFDGGSQYLTSEFWTNGKELVALIVSEVYLYNATGDTTDEVWVEAFSIGKLKEIEEVEISQAEILQAYLTLNPSSEKKWLRVSINHEDYAIEVKKVYQDQLKTAYWVDIGVGHDSDRLYYHRDSRTGQLTGLFNYYDELSCQLLKEKNINQAEYNALKKFLKDAEEDIFLEEISQLDCHL